MFAVRSVAVALALASTTVSLDAAAQAVTANAAGIASILQDRKLSARLDTERGGDPMIHATFGEHAAFVIYFYGCTSGADCTSIQFRAGFTNTGAGPAEIAKWNADYRFARAYLDDENDAVIAMDVDLEAGMSAKAFGKQVDIWDDIMHEFSDYVFSGTAPTSQT